MIDPPTTVDVPLRTDEHGVIRVGKMRVTLLTIVGLCEYQAYIEPHISKITSAIFFEGLEGRREETAKAVQDVAAEARMIESRLSTATWLGGAAFSAADAVVFPGIQLLLRALERREAQDLRANFLPLDARFPAVAAWTRRIENLPGYDRTYPPHWRG